MIIGCAVGSVIVLVVLLGCYINYTFAVLRNQRKLVAKNRKAEAIVESLYPGSVKDRVLAETDNDSNHSVTKRKGSRERESFSVPGIEEKKKEELSSSPPIADLFPSVTIMVSSPQRHSTVLTCSLTPK